MNHHCVILASNNPRTPLDYVTDYIYNMSNSLE